MIPPNRYQRLSAGAIALLTWLGLLLQFYVTISVARSTAVPMVTAIVNLFSFFTILTNLLVAVVMTFSFQSLSTTTSSRFAVSPTVQTATALYIAIVGIIYSLVLRNVWDPEGLQKIADVILHDAVPLLYSIYWLGFVRKNGLRFTDIPDWLAYPAIYLVYSMARGTASGRYVYPFLDVVQLGYGRVLANIFLLMAAFIGGGLLLVAIGKWRSKPR